MIEQNGNLLVQNIRVRMNHNIITTVNLVQGDTAREFHFFFDDYIVPPESEIRIYIQKPSGLEFYGECTLKNNEIIVQPRLQMVAEKGKNLGQIQIINAGEVISTFVFYLAIEKNLIYSTSITSSNEFEILDNLIQEARETIPILKDVLETAIEQEQERVDAENKRVDEFNSIKEQFNTQKEENEQLISDLTTLKSDLEEAESNRQNDFDQKISDLNDAISNAATATESANSAYEKADEANTVADDTIQKLNDAIASLDNLNPSLISITQPQSQNIGGLWFVEVVRGGE